MDGWPFDGGEEISLRLERGESFGLSKAQYGALAHIAMGAQRMAKVEPAEIRLLADRPGCDVILYGSHFVYTIRMEPALARSSLYALPLDSQLSGPGCELYTHAFRGTDYVGGILATILLREGVEVLTPREFLRRQEF
jgi:hypothetical protein